MNLCQLVEQQKTYITASYGTIGALLVCIGQPPTNHDALNFKKCVANRILTELGINIYSEKHVEYINARTTEIPDIVYTIIQTTEVENMLREYVVSLTSVCNSTIAYISVLSNTPGVYESRFLYITTGCVKIPIKLNYSLLWFLAHPECVLFSVVFITPEAESYIDTLLFGDIVKSFYPCEIERLIDAIDNELYSDPNVPISNNIHSLVQYVERYAQVPCTYINEIVPTEPSITINNAVHKHGVELTATYSLVIKLPSRVGGCAIVSVKIAPTIFGGKPLAQCVEICPHNAVLKPLPPHVINVKLTFTRDQLLSGCLSNVILYTILICTPEQVYIRCIRFKDHIGYLVDS
jgi:hypothetical protein